MSLNNLTHSGVLAAIDEFDALGRDKFLSNMVSTKQGITTCCIKGVFMTQKLSCGPQLNILG